MRYSEHPPALGLRRFVEILEDDQPNPGRPVERILPDGCKELIVHFRIGTLGIRFRPAGACAFFRVPMDALTDQVVPLDAPCGNDAELFREQVAERFLRRLQSAAGHRGPDARLGWSPG